MRASRKGKGGGSCAADIHISGAEGIYEDPERKRVVREYMERAVSHPRGKPDEIIITIERLRKKPVEIHALPVSTLKCNSPSEAENHITRILTEIGISGTAVRNGLRVVRGDAAMRGASVLLSESGMRVEPDKKRGVRASRLGISNNAYRSLSLKLAKNGLNNSTVKEAVILASKVVSCRDVLAELCVSDDPDYATGYIASGKYGYVRIPHIKKNGTKEGGRVFFIKEGADIGPVIDYLEKIPVIIVRTAKCKGTYLLDEILDSHHF